MKARKYLRLSTLTICLSFYTLIFSQVTIGSSIPPQKDALLDIKENEDGTSEKGLLIPRVSLTSTVLASPLSSHVKGMVIYNTATKNDVTPGLYYNDGKKWISSSNTSNLNQISNAWYIIGTEEHADSNLDHIWHQGKVSIGSTIVPLDFKDATLYIRGDVSTSGKYYTTSSVYADYVFEHYYHGESAINPDYQFKSIHDIEKFIDENKHLPGITKINELEQTEKGYTIDMTSLVIQQLEKIEELYLHVIELNKKIDLLQEKQKK